MKQQDFFCNDSNFLCHSNQCGRREMGRPIMAVKDSDGTIEFKITETESEYTDLKNSFIQIKAKIMNADGEPVGPTDDVWSVLGLRGNKVNSQHRRGTKTQITFLWTKTMRDMSKEKGLSMKIT